MKKVSLYIYSENNEIFGVKSNIGSIIHFTTDIRPNVYEMNLEVVMSKRTCDNTSMVMLETSDIDVEKGRMKKIDVDIIPEYENINIYGLSHLIFSHPSINEFIKK